MFASASGLLRSWPQLGWSIAFCTSMMSSAAGMKGGTVTRPSDGCATLMLRMIDRRGAPRHPVPADVTADVSGIAARLIELSLVGAKVEHHDRFALTSSQLTIVWRGNLASIAVRAARSEIV